jgi:hypothetical protein
MLKRTTSGEQVVSRSIAVREEHILFRDDLELDLKHGSARDTSLILSDVL